jgi:hypothetical protein
MHKRSDNEMLKVEFTDDAKNYIRQKEADSITVDMMVCGGCGGEHSDPFVSVGKPSSPESYDLVEAGGIKVYMFKGAVSKPDGLKIYLDGSMIVYKRLDIEGLVYSLSSLDR